MVHETVNGVPLPMMTVIACITTQHDPRLVVVPALVCAMACFTALSLLGRATAAGGNVRRFWQASAGFAFGCGVWATHFIAMLAFQPDMPVGYSVPETLGSLLLAVAGAWPAFSLPSRRSSAELIVAGTVLGGSIAAMHFLGMSALRIPGMVIYAPAYVAVSIACGVGLSIAALRQRVSARPAGRVLGPVFLVLAVCSLHFTAMAGVSLVPLSGFGPDSMVMAPELLAAAVALGAAVILGLSLTGSMIDQHLCSRAVMESDRLRQLADASFEGIMIHEAGVIIAANQALCRLYGHDSPESVVGRHVTDFVAPDCAEEVRERLQQPSGTHSELSILAADGTMRPVEVCSRPIEYQGRKARVVGIRDLSARKAAEERIRYLAHHDALTGLANRHLFNDRLKRASAEAERSGESVAVLCLDLDHFKSSNDLYGHPAGDELLKQVARRLQDAVRAVDTVARLGGDEFAILQNRLDTADGAGVLASRLVAELAEPYEVHGHHIVIGVSIGVAMFPADGRAEHELVANADTALYRAKHDGRGTFRFFEREMNERLHKRLSLERELRQALPREELELHYQPLYHCNTPEIAGFEVLLRWNHPRLGRVPPAEFIPLAEETGLIVPIGRWVLNRACMEAAGWANRIKVAVNLSPAQFRNNDLPGLVAEALAMSGIEPDRLELEVTEGLLIADADKALDVMDRLKTLGVRLVLDDFGTGYSSLSCLQRFPFDKIKIDQSFVRGLEQPQNMAIVRAIVALGRALDLQITAEGVETPGQLELLRGEACDQVQGYFLGRPDGRASVSALLAGQRLDATDQGEQSVRRALALT